MKKRHEISVVVTMATLVVFLAGVYVGAQLTPTVVGPERNRSIDVLIRYDEEQEQVFPDENLPVRITVSELATLLEERHGLPIALRRVGDLVWVESIQGVAATEERAWALSLDGTKAFPGDALHIPQGESNTVILSRELLP